MSWSKDQRPTHAHALAASAASNNSSHPAASLMDRRWEQRRAAAEARWSDNTSSLVLERADVSGVQPTAPVASDALLEDMRRLELGDQPFGTGPVWLRDTGRAMLLVAAVSCSTLLALLYFGGFLG